MYVRTKYDSQFSQSWIGTGLLCLFFYTLCYAAVLKILTYYAQYYAQEQELCSAQ